MLRLHLLRHAQAASALNGVDKDRPLSEEGIEQAKTVGKCMDDIDLVLCSSAERTRMTLEALKAAGAKFEKTVYSDDLYNAMAGDILSAIQSSHAARILVIAHNPGIHQLANMLAGSGENILLEKMRIFYQPATLAMFDCDIESWADLKPQVNTLTDLIISD